MTIVETRRQIHVSRKESGVAFLLLDCAGKLNSIGTTVMAELQEALDAIARDPGIKAVVMMSGKPDNFIIGADLFEIRKLTTQQELHRLSQDGQQTLNRIASLEQPVVVAINGICLGGGLELALAGHFRIATDHRSTQLGLPEVKLGIVPGLGGTQRLPRLIGLKSALAMILSADPVSAREALEMGLVDELVTPEALMARAESKALELINDPAAIAKRRVPGLPADYDAEKSGRLFAMTERSVRIKTRGNYPAQSRVLEVIKTGLSDGMEKGLQAEASTFAELAAGEVAANLISLFFATDFARQSASSLAAKFNENVKTVGIVGGGTMGTSIAQLCAGHGLDVLVKLRCGQRQSESEHIQFVGSYEQLSGADIVIEAVTEDLASKIQVLKELESAVPSGCVIASNTSSLPLTELANVLEKSDRFVGLHFFHPVDKMPAVEIIALKSTSRGTLARAADCVTKLGKIPIMVKDGPGFLINRLLTCYLYEAARMGSEGVPLNWIEEAAIDFGMPMGPIEVMDEVGVDIYAPVAASLHNAFGARMEPPTILKQVQDLGLIGKKTGRGVYAYDESGRKKEFNPDMHKIAGVNWNAEKADPSTRQQLAERLIFPMVDEAARCLEDRVVMKPREIDIAIIHGIGFPPFRGGILKYADHIGLKAIASRLQEIYAGSARTISPLIEKYLAEGRSFYSRAGKEEE